MLDIPNIKTDRSKTYIEFDMPAIYELESSIDATIDFLLAELPDINWSSRLDVKDYFLAEHRLYLESIKISELILINSTIQDEYSELKNVLTLFIEYLKLKYLKRNYIDCILRHNINGKMYLREVSGQLVYPNKRPISYSTHITDCIISQGQDQ